ncbi:DoxX family protein [Rhodococcus fascians]|nr:DoxX family protein [Rhodococcus fascians]MBY3999511.1 DoxX family protein [Rhodococcus fascians]MBY4005044.1 DoxX family protein [Rhodococcus fascians]MBY4010083.1 DoxX family protein [Rhodococcus fascians]MBY4020251.1 DoxX family protein [Rhodococcus fascians]
MNVVLWILAGVLAAVFVLSGGMKVLGKREDMIEKTPYVEDFPQGAVRGIGVVEVLGAVGLIVPALTGIPDVLVPLAASGLVLVMIGAVVVHLRRGEGVKAAAPAIVFAIISAVVAWGRFGPYSF